MHTPTPKATKLRIKQNTPKMIVQPTHPAENSNVNMKGKYLSAHRIEHYAHSKFTNTHLRKLTQSSNTTSTARTVTPPQRTQQNKKYH